MITVSRDIDIAPMTTFGIHARCSAVVSYSDIGDLSAIIADKRLPRPLKHIGEGSNLLFTSDFPGTIIHSECRDIRFDESDNDVEVTASAGVSMDHLCKIAAERGLWGLENLSGIPGEVGASAVQNVGAYGVEAADIIVRANAIDLENGEERMFSNEDLSFGYRDSVFKRETSKNRFIITEVTFRLQKSRNPRLGYANLSQIVAVMSEGSEATPETVRRAVIAMRDSKLPDPKSVGSAGSFFKNPVVDSSVYLQIVSTMTDKLVPHFDLPDGKVKIPAAWLIDNAGCKSFTEGGAAVWPKQPLVIVNATGTATGADVARLESRIISAVGERFGITLSPEVEHLP